jgi:hypothetical protein
MAVAAGAIASVDSGSGIEDVEEGGIMIVIVIADVDAEAGGRGVGGAPQAAGVAMEAAARAASTAEARPDGAVDGVAAA